MLKVTNTFFPFVDKRNENDNNSLLKESPNIALWYTFNSF